MAGPTRLGHVVYNNLLNFAITSNQNKAKAQKSQTWKNGQINSTIRKLDRVVERLRSRTKVQSLR